MDIAGTTIAPATEAVAPPNTFDLSEFRKEKEAGAAPVVAVQEPPPAHVVEPKPDAQATQAEPIEAQAAATAEADSSKPDAELSEAARKLRGNRKDERVKKMRADNDDLAREMQRRIELRSEMDRLATGHPATAGADGKPAGTAVAHPNDPEPTLDSFAAAHPDHPDPYAGFLRAQAAWDRRQEQRASDTTRRESEQRARDEQTRTQMHERAAEARAQFSDYDAVLLGLDQAIGDHPAQDVITRFVARSKVGGQIAYRLGKDVAATVEAIKGGRDALVAHIGAVEASLTAAAPKPGATAPLFTAAPAPHKPVAAAASAGTTFSVGASGEFDVNEYRRAKDAGRLPAELR